MLAPVELCAECPQLIDEVRRRIRAVVDMEQVMGVGGDDQALTAPRSAPEAHEDEYPSIPGYEIIRVVDQGGMGIVYEARQMELGRTVAVKMISGVRSAPSLLARFRAEAAASARLQHPNFVQIFEVGQVNGRPFFSMEFVKGGSLAQQLARQRPSPRHAAELVETLAQAIHTAHECGIVHRDLKPANVMLTPDGIPKIADFGLAKLLDAEHSHTQTGEILGTPSYMAPEQASGTRETIGPATDVYSLGAIFYELLTGQPPFRGASALDSLRLLTSQEPVAPTRLVQAIPPDLEAICLKCLEKTPRLRYPSARELAEDLRRFLDGQPVSARRIGKIGRAWKWARRHPQGVALAGAAIVLVIIPAMALLGHWRAQQQLRRTALEQAPLVREILERNCFSCHGQDPADIKKNLNILDHKLLLDKKRRLVVPGAPADSRIIQRIADGSMPPEEDEIHLPRVSEMELSILKDWVLGGAPPLPPEDPEAPTAPVVPYSELAAKTKAIFHKHCYQCHKYDVAKGGIKILNYRLLVTVRQVVVPGNPEDSELFQLLTTTDNALRMPRPPGQPLSAKEIATIREWIEEGAPPFP